MAAFVFTRSAVFEIARVLVRFDHIASIIVNVNHGVMSAAVLAGVAGCIADSVRSVRQQEQGSVIKS